MVPTPRRSPGTPLVSGGRSFDDASRWRLPGYPTPPDSNSRSKSTADGSCEPPPASPTMSPLSVQMPRRRLRMSDYSPTPSITIDSPRMSSSLTELGSEHGLGPQASPFSSNMSFGSSEPSPILNFASPAHALSPATMPGVISYCRGGSYPPSYTTSLPDSPYEVLDTPSQQPYASDPFLFNPAGEGTSTGFSAPIFDDLSNVSMTSAGPLGLRAARLSNSPELKSEDGEDDEESASNGSSDEQPEGEDLQMANQDSASPKRRSQWTPMEGAPYKCEKCQRGFPRRFNYHEHLKAHRKDRPRPYECLVPNCDKSFRRPADLTRHHRSVHEQSRAFVCELCGTGFPRKDSLERHMQHGCARRKTFMKTKSRSPSVSTELRNSRSSTLTAQPSQASQYPAIQAMPSRAMASASGFGHQPIRPRGQPTLLASNAQGMSRQMPYMPSGPIQWPSTLVNQVNSPSYTVNPQYTINSQHPNVTSVSVPPFMGYMSEDPFTPLQYGEIGFDQPYAADQNQNQE